jgi:excisionase family DNA binding protein
LVGSWAFDLEVVMSAEYPVRPAQIAALYGVGESTVYRWAKRQLLPCIQLPSGQYRFHRDALHGIDRQLAPRELRAAAAEDQVTNEIR